MSKTPIVDAEILKTKVALRGCPEYDRIFEQYQSMRDLARDLEEKLMVVTAERNRFRTALEKIAASDDSEAGCYYSNRGSIRLASTTLRETSS